MTATFPLRLVERRMLAPSVGHYAFVRDDGHPLDFRPGQSIRVHFARADGTPLIRSYSLATRHDHALGPGEAVEIAVGFVPGGAATALFEGLHPGDTIQASGPVGDFCLHPDDHNARYLLIGTGTGIAPYRAMLPQLAAQMAVRGVEAVVLHGVRSPAELLYGDEFLAFARQHPGLRFMPCFSRQLPTAAGLAACKGYVQQHLDGLAPDPVRDIAYLCGNPRMVDACTRLLQARGLPSARIRREQYPG